MFDSPSLKWLWFQLQLYRARYRVKCNLRKLNSTLSINQNAITGAEFLPGEGEGYPSFCDRDVPLGKWKLTHTFTKFGPKIGPIYLPTIFAPIFYVKFAHIFSIFFGKIGYWKKMTTHIFTWIPPPPPPPPGVSTTVFAFSAHKVSVITGKLSEQLKVECQI